MRKKIGFAAAAIAATVLATSFVRPTFAQQLLGGFEQTLVSTAGGTSFGGLSITGPEYSAIGATEGTSALVLRHAPDWVTDGFKLAGGMPLAQLTSQHDFLQLDLTTMDYGIAGDGWAPSWRVGWVIFNGSVGGWQQSSQFDFPVASDDGGSSTQTITLDIGTSGVRANAQNFVNTGGGANPYWEMLIVLIGGEQGIRPGDYSNDTPVNAQDYVIWRKTVGGTGLPNETVSPGLIDSADYDEWRRNFGGRVTTIIDNIRFVNAGSGSGGLSTSGVPEPSSSILLFTAALMLAGRRRNRI
jgi:hypothetical protein